MRCSCAPRRWQPRPATPSCGPLQGERGSRRSAASWQLPSARSPVIAPGAAQQLHPAPAPPPSPAGRTHPTIPDAQGNVGPHPDEPSFCDHHVDHSGLNHAPRPPARHRASQGESAAARAGKTRGEGMGQPERAGALGGRGAVWQGTRGGDPGDAGTPHGCPRHDRRAWRRQS
jgi:hypothetical protein